MGFRPRERALAAASEEIQAKTPLEEHELKSRLHGRSNSKPTTVVRTIAYLCHFLFVLLSLALAAGCNRSASPGAAGSNLKLTKVTLQADWYPQPEHGGFYTALVKGYYKEEGLDLTIQPGSQYLVPDQQVAVGAAQFGMGSSDRTLESVADGHPLVAVAATMQNDPQGIMVRQDSAIHSFTDLHGHTVAVKPGSTWFQFLVKRFQLTDVREIPATMSVANFVADPSYIQQAFATSEPFFARKAGIETRVMLTNSAGYNPYRVMFTTRDFLARRPDTVAGFVRASLKGWRTYLADPADAHTAIAKLNPALSPDWMQFSWQAMRDGHFVAGDAPSGAQLGRMTSERWSTMYKQLLDLKVIDKPFDPAIAYTLQFLPPK
jgi:NitT/TauT family transport system substrate-binding protein